MATFVLDTKTLVPILFGVLIAEIALLAIFPAAQTLVRDLWKADDLLGFDAAKALKAVTVANVISVALSVAIILAILVCARLCVRQADAVTNVLTLIKTVQFGGFSIMLCWYVLRSHPK